MDSSLGMKCLRSSGKCKQLQFIGLSSPRLLETKVARGMPFCFEMSTTDDHLSSCNAALWKLLWLAPRWQLMQRLLLAQEGTKGLAGASRLAVTLMMTLLHA